MLCSWARHLTLTVPLSTQVYKWVLTNLMLGVTLRWTSIPSRAGVEIPPVASCYRNRDKLRPSMGHLARMQTLPTYLPHPWSEGVDPHCYTSRVRLPRKFRVKIHEVAIHRVAIGSFQVSHFSLNGFHH